LRQDAPGIREATRCPLLAFNLDSVEKEMMKSQDQHVSFDSGVCLGSLSKHTASNLAHVHVWAVTQEAFTQKNMKKPEI
jgi:hypothetical protein